MSYTKINWEEETPVNAYNLNKMDTGIAETNEEIEKAYEEMLNDLKNKYEGSEE